MTNDRGWDEHRSAPALHPPSEQRVLTESQIVSERPGSEAEDFMCSQVEASGTLERGFPKEHVAGRIESVLVIDIHASLERADVTRRNGRPLHDVDTRSLHRIEPLGEPIGIGHAVAIRECDDLPARIRNAGVPGDAHPAAAGSHHAYIH